MKKLIVMAAIAFAVTACGKKETPAPAPVAAAQDVGAEVYNMQCSSCHGNEGKGDGTAGAALKPKPRNFTDAKWKFGSELPKVIATITNGSKGTSMAAYKDMLSAAEIEAVAKHVRKLGGKQ